MKTRNLSLDEIKRAVQSCKNKIHHHYENTRFKKSNAIKNEYTKIAALEKQIPQKPVIAGELYNCPLCGDAQAILRGDKYCSVCGQALTWSDTK